MMMTVRRGSDSRGGDGLMEASVGGGVPGLAEQIGHIEELVTRLVTRTEEAARSQQENIINGNSEEGELSLPSSIGAERRINLFLQAESAEQLAELRHHKDHWRAP